MKVSPNHFPRSINIIGGGKSCDTFVYDAETNEMIDNIDSITIKFDCDNHTSVDLTYCDHKGLTGIIHRRCPDINAIIINPNIGSGYTKPLEMCKWCRGLGLEDTVTSKENICLMCKGTGIYDE